MITVRKLVKRFGSKLVLRGVDFAIQPGEFVALLGPNGSGKTTFLRILASLARPSLGEVVVAGHRLPLQAAQVRARLGVVTHLPLLYGDLTAEENLRFFGRIYGTPDLDHRITEILGIVALQDRRRDAVRTFSRGMQQRLAIGRAVLHDPEVLLLDEPYTGLDQDAAGMLDDVLRSVAARGRTVLMTSHDLVRAEELATRFDVLTRGVIAASAGRKQLGKSNLLSFYKEAMDHGLRTMDGGRWTIDDRPETMVRRPSSMVHSQWSAFARAVTAIVQKDLISEYRSRELFTAMLVFSILVIFIFNFALELDVSTRRTVTSGVLWSTFVFAGTLGLNRSLAAEQDRGSFEGLLLAPVDRSAIYFGKAISNLAFMLIVQAIVLPIYSALYGVNLFQPGLLLVVLLGSIGYSAVGTLLATMAVQTRTRDVLLPILLFPVVLPLLIAAVKASAGFLTGADPAGIAPWLNLLVAYDVIFIALAFMLYDYVVEE